MDWKKMLEFDLTQSGLNKANGGLIVLDGMPDGRMYCRVHDLLAKESWGTAILPTTDGLSVETDVVGFKAPLCPLARMLDQKRFGYAFWDVYGCLRWDWHDDFFITNKECARPVISAVYKARSARFEHGEVPA